MNFYIFGLKNVQSHILSKNWHFRNLKQKCPQKFFKVNLLIDLLIGRVHPHFLCSDICLSVVCINIFLIWPQCAPKAEFINKLFPSLYFQGRAFAIYVQENGTKNCLGTISYWQSCNFSLQSRKVYHWNEYQCRWRNSLGLIST